MMHRLYSQLRRWLHAHQTEGLLVSLSLLVNLAVGAALFFAHGPAFIMLGDTDTFGYLEIANNIVSGEGFRMDGVISALRPPLYPLYIAFFLLLKLPAASIVIGQYIAAAVSAILVYRLGSFLFSRSVGFAASLLFLLEPYMILLNNSAMTEPLFSMLVLFGVYSLFRYAYASEHIRWICVSAISFGLATLVRPTMLYAPILCVLILGAMWRRQGIGWRIRARTALIFTLLFAAVLAPWSMRQYLQFQTWRPSSVDTYLLYWRVLPLAVSSQEGISYEDAIAQLRARLHERIPEFDPVAMQHTFVYDEILNEEIVRGVRNQFGPVLRYYFFSNASAFFTTGYDRLLELAGFPRGPQLHLTQAIHRGDYISALRGLQPPTAVQTARIAGAVLWIMLYAITFIGVVQLWRSGRNRRLIVALCLSILFFTLFAVGPQVYVRYRLPTYPFWFLLFSISALQLLKKKVKKDSI